MMEALLSFKVFVDICLFFQAKDCLNGFWHDTFQQIFI